MPLRISSFLLFAMPIILLLLSGCASTLEHRRALAGKVIESVGETFMETALLYDGLMANEIISKQEYQAWVDFSLRFRALFPVLTEQWQRGMAEDAEIIDYILRMRTELLLFRERVKSRIRT